MDAKDEVVKAQGRADLAEATVRLNTEDQQVIDELAPLFGGTSNAICQALRSPAADSERHHALESFLAGWEAEAGPVDEEAVAAMACRYGL